MINELQQYKWAVKNEPQIRKMLEDLYSIGFSKFSLRTPYGKVTFEPPEDNGEDS